MQFASLGASGAGNAFFVQIGDTAILLDCGLHKRELIDRAQTVGVNLRPEPILDGIVVTHHHYDHIVGAAEATTLLRQGGKVHVTTDTLQSRRATALREKRLQSRVSAFQSGSTFWIGGVKISSHAVPHTPTATNVALRLSNRGESLAYVTDVDRVDLSLLEFIEGVTILILEFNHPSRVFRNFRRVHKLRPSTRFGHLSNEKAGDVIGWMNTRDHGRNLRLVAATHLSHRFNTAQLVQDVFTRAWHQGDGGLDMPTFVVLPGSIPSPVMHVEPGERGRVRLALVS